jgi:hypothetical protein
MMEQVEKLGLVLDKTHVEDGIKPNYGAPFDNTLKFLYILGGKHLREVTGTFTDLHDSVKKRWCDPKCDYRPENLIRFQADLDA